MWLKNRVNKEMEQVVKKYAEGNEKKSYDILMVFEVICLICVPTLYFEGMNVLIYSVLNAEGWVMKFWRFLGVLMLVLFYVLIKIGSYIDGFKVSYCNEYYYKNICKPEIDKLEKELFPNGLKKNFKEIIASEKEICQEKQKKFEKMDIDIRGAVIAIYTATIPVVVSALIPIMWEFAQNLNGQAFELFMYMFIGALLILALLSPVIYVLYTFMFFAPKKRNEKRLKNLNDLYERCCNNTKIKKRNKKKHNKNLKYKTNLKATVDVNYK